MPPDWQAGTAAVLPGGAGGGVIHKSWAAVIAAASWAVGGLCPRPPALSLPGLVPPPLVPGTLLL